MNVNSGKKRFGRGRSQTDSRGLRRNSSLSSSHIQGRRNSRGRSLSPRGRNSNSRERRR